MSWAVARVRKHAGPLSFGDYADLEEQADQHEHAEFDHREVLHAALRVQHGEDALQVTLDIFQSESHNRREDGVGEWLCAFVMA